MTPVPSDHSHEHFGGDADLDAAFAEIIAGWDDVATDPVPRWPAVEDAPDAEDRGGADDSADGGAPPPTSMEQIRYVRDHGLPTPDPEAAPAGPRPVEPAGSGPRDWELADTDDHYQPPEPPPIPRGDLTGRVAWAAVVLGPLFLLFAGLFWRDVSRLWLALAAAAFIGGFVALVVRLPDARDDDGDDGAVV